jgi:Suppressor of fused protein (SUFU)
MTNKHIDLIESHYTEQWRAQCVVRRLNKGPSFELPADFCVLEFSPTTTRSMWTYATCCMSQPLDSAPVELHLFSPMQSELHVELLTIIAHYHRTQASLALGHTVNFGRPWIAGSLCEHGLISLPYLDGPALEEYFQRESNRVIRFYWLVPITKAERDYKIEFGLEALESRLEAAQFNYLNPKRSSVV